MALTTQSRRRCHGPTCKSLLARHCKTILGSAKWTGVWDRIGHFLHDDDMIENEGLWPSGFDDFSQKYRNFVETLDSHRLLAYLPAPSVMSQWGQVMTATFKV